LEDKPLTSLHIDFSIIAKICVDFYKRLDKDYPQGEGIAVVDKILLAISLIPVLPQLGQGTSKNCEDVISTSLKIPCLQCQHSNMTLLTGWLQSSTLICCEGVGWFDIFLGLGSCLISRVSMFLFLLYRN
jgi:hypothetical protein